MTSSSPEGRQTLFDSMTIPSDSENYDANNESSPSPPSSQGSPLILYSPPTLWGLLRGAAINLLLPFINGLMLGFGELLAHEAAFRLGWSGTKVRVVSTIHLPWALRARKDGFLRISAYATRIALCKPDANCPFQDIPEPPKHRKAHGPWSGDSRRSH